MTNRRRVLVTGSRDWTDPAPIFRALYYQRIIAGERGLTIVHGACPTGADAIADRWGHQFYPDTVNVETYPADWSACRPTCRHQVRRRANGTVYCPAAGHYRNQQMVDLGADICLAFPFPDSRGTRDCMGRAASAGIPVQPFEGHPMIVVDPAPEVAGP